MIEVLKNLSFHFAPFCIIKAAIETDITYYLKENFISPEELSAKTQLDVEGIKRIVAALYQMKLLEKKEEKFKIKNELEKFFDPQSPFYIEYYLQHLQKLHARWMNLKEALKGEKEPLSDTKDISVLAKALFPINWESALKLERELNIKAEKILDVGCGSCVWSIPFALNKAKVFALDFPEVIEKTAKPIVRDFKLENLFSFIEGNLFEVDWGREYELIIWGNICHIFSYEEVRIMFKKSHNALKYKGQLVIIDFVKDTASLFPYLFDINMYLATRSGRTYSEKEITDLAKETGLKYIKSILLDVERNHIALVLGKI